MAELQLCTVDDIKIYARRFTEQVGFDDTTIETFGLMAQRRVRNALRDAFSKISDGTSWVHPTTAPEQIVEIVAELAARMMHWDVLVASGRIDVSMDSYCNDLLDEIYALRGYDKKGNQVSVVPLYKRDKTVEARSQVNPYISTASEDHELTMTTYTDSATGDVYNEGSLDDYRGDLVF